jgi:hypothetical protein
MNIVGEGFSGDIIRQIDQRQKIAGSLKRTNEQLLYLNNKTGWVRMVSSVNVTQSGIRNLPYVGDKLAEEFILFNGVTSSTTGARAGVWPGTGPSENYAYGLGGTNFGLKPIPGITQASIKTETRGSLKTATINIIAHNKEQFDIIDVLYMRLGYSILLEWGHSNFFYNNGTYESNNPFSLANSFLSGALTYDNHLEQIQIQRNESNGNYDAIIAKVVNFNWNYTKEGTYNITLTLRSMGDVIESIKSNILLPGGTVTEKKDLDPKQPTPSSTQVIKAFSETHEIGKVFYEAQQFLSTRTSNNKSATITSKDNKSTGYDDNRISVTYYKQTYGGEGGEQYYVKFSQFLHILQSKIIPNVDNENVKLLKINNRVKSNIIYNQNRQISSNPGICNFNTSFGGGKFIFMPAADEYLLGGSGGYKFGGNYYGQAMNIYFNMSFILTQIESLKDKDGKVSLYDLLNSLCKGWNQATGYVNKLEPIINAETLEIIIIDKTALPDRDAILNRLELNTTTAKFNVYGLYYDKDSSTSATGGFIRDLNFSTTISPELATMITIGATSNGYILGEDATALSRMNSGLVDRFKKKITTPTTDKFVDNDTFESLKNRLEQKTPETEGSDTFQDQIKKSMEAAANEVKDPLEKDYKNVFNALNTFIAKLSSGDGTKTPTWDQEAITAFSSVQTQLLEYEQFKKSKAEQILTSTKETQNNICSPNVGFLPFDLNITIDGLSGIKVYQKYLIDTTFLPSNYPETLEFIIKGITHTISNNEWITSLESFAIPKNPFGLKQDTTSQLASNSNINTPPSQGNLNAIKGNNSLRQVLLNAGYSENSPEYRFAFAIGSREGWDANANGGIGTRSYRNNNPGNLDFSTNLRSIDSGVALESNPFGPNRFAHFTTAELGAKALVETKIKQWANGNMPPTEGNQILIVNRKGGNRWIANQPPTIAQFFYTYAPPNENNTEQYISGVINDLRAIKPNINRNTLVKDILV